MKPCCFLCKKRKIWASIIAKPPSKPHNSRIDLTSKMQIQEPWSVKCAWHAFWSYAHSQRELSKTCLQCTSAAFEISKSEGKFCLLSVLSFSRRSAGNLRPGLIISIQDQWVLQNLWCTVEVRSEWVSNHVGYKNNCSCRPWEWIPDRNTMLGWAKPEALSVGPANIPSKTCTSKIQSCMCGLKGTPKGTQKRQKGKPCLQLMASVHLNMDYGVSVLKGPLWVMEVSSTSYYPVHPLILSPAQ